MFEGHTVASTATYLLLVTVQTVTERVRGLHLDDFEVDIPFTEQDNPLDLDIWDAASLENDSGTEL